jgi:hypothetical protein
MVVLIEGSGKKLQCVVNGCGAGGEGEAVWSRAEMTCTPGTRPGQGHEGTKILRARLVGSRTEISTSPLGRSSNQHSRAC